MVKKISPFINEEHFPLNSFVVVNSAIPQQQHSIIVVEEETI
jgi:hypothetical protein